MAERKSKIATDILRRVRWLYFFFLLTAIAIFARAVWIQWGPDGDELREKSQKISYEHQKIEAARGDILAGDGRILATSIPTYEIRMDFAAGGLSDEVFNRDVDSLAHCLATFFKDKSKAAYKKLLIDARNNRSKNRYRLISPRRVDYLEEKEVKQFPILRLGQNKGGYLKVQVNKRIHPHGGLAQRTIGMTNESGVKLGVEGAFDNQLKGKDGRTLTQKVSGSFRVPVPDPLNVDPENGMDVVTTLDIDIQDVAETALKRQLEAKSADWGTLVLMEVATGEIHAMSNITRKAPGKYVEDFNYAIGRRSEPGSTFKLATLITLLEDGGMKLDDMVDCENGFARVGPRPIRDDHGEKVISLRRVFEVSSNIGFAKSVYQRYHGNEQRYVDFINKMGFDQPMGMQIAGEQNALIKDPKVKNDRNNPKIWDGTTLAQMAYGYALEITPMHTLMLYNAVANNGRMVRPKLVKEVQSYGKTVNRFDLEPVNKQICSPATVKMAQECLMGVVDEGTGRILKNDYYTVAAKTGTAQMVHNGRYQDANGGRHYIATMVGYFPADRPKYSCIVVMKTYHGPPSYNSYYGAGLAGPVFRAVADRVYASHPEWHERVAKDSVRHTAAATDIKGGEAREIRRVADKLDVPVKIDRSTERWVQPVREAAAVADSVSGKTYIDVASAERESGQVPSVVGMGLKDAIFLLENKGMKVAFSGSGRVLSQSVIPGTKIVKGQVVTLVLGK